MKEKNVVKFEECVVIRYDVDNDDYELDCRLENEKYTHFLDYKKKDNHLEKMMYSRGYDEEKGIKKIIKKVEVIYNLDDYALKQVKAAVEEFDNKVSYIKQNGIHIGKSDFYYLKDGINYTILHERLNKKKYNHVSVEKIDDMQHFIRTICNKPYDKDFYQLVSENKDRYMYLELQIFYNKATKAECVELSRLLGKEILPKSNYDVANYYPVSVSTIDKDLLHRSGYKVHKIDEKNMDGKTEDIYMLNPYTKDGIACGSIKFKPIEFNEYLKIVKENC